MPLASQESKYLEKPQSAFLNYKKKKMLKNKQISISISFNTLKSIFPCLNCAFSTKKSRLLYKATI